MADQKVVDEIWNQMEDSKNGGKEMDVSKFAKLISEKVGGTTDQVKEFMYENASNKDAPKQKGEKDAK